MLSINFLKMKKSYIHNGITKNKILKNIFSKRCVRLVCCKLENTDEKN